MFNARFQRRGGSTISAKSIRGVVLRIGIIWVALSLNVLAQEAGSGASASSQSSSQDPSATTSLTAKPPSDTAAAAQSHAKELSTGESASTSPSAKETAASESSEKVSPSTELPSREPASSEPAASAPQPTETRRPARTAASGSINEAKVKTSDWGELPREALWARDGSVMILIPAGEFTMGLNRPESQGGRVQESPAHKVMLSSYYIDKYEITNEQYNRFAAATGHIRPRLTRGAGLADLDRPVVGVSWDDAVAYAQWAGKDIPTEAQWEKAARGDRSNAYPWGPQWESGAANTKDSGLGTSAKPGSFPKDKSVFGVMDMAGNVSEWVLDYYDRDYYRSSPSRDPQGPTASAFSHVYRGGDYYNTKDKARVTARHYRPGNQAIEECGFRCVKNLKLVPTPTPRPTIDLSEAAPTPISDPFGPIEPELFKCWKTGTPLPVGLTPMGAGGKSSITLINLIPTAISFSLVSTEQQVVVYNQSMAPLSKLDISVPIEVDTALYVKAAADNIIHRASPTFRSNSHPIMVLEPTRFLSTLVDPQQPAKAPDPYPELDIYYQSPTFLWNRVLFFNSTPTTVSLQFEKCPLVEPPSPESKKEIYTAQLGPAVVWEASMLPGKHNVRIFYLGGFESGADPVVLEVNNKYDRQALIVKVNTTTNRTVRVFTKQLPILQSELLQSKIGGSGIGR